MEKAAEVVAAYITASSSEVPQIMAIFDIWKSSATQMNRRSKISDTHWRDLNLIYS
jgi:hypothetical protein